MKLIINGEINPSYVQTLCLIFFPGAKFAENEVVTEETPVVEVTVREEKDGFFASADMKYGDAVGSCQYTFPRSSAYTSEKSAKIAVGAAIYGAGEKLFDYMPPWGILTGIRPAKIAGKLYSEHGSKAAVRKVLVEDYLVSPKKARLVTDIAVSEQNTFSKYKGNTCSLYISIPFCPTRCAYCSFVSYSTKRLLSMIPEYLVRLTDDIDRVTDIIKEKGQEIVSVYIGGGTPTTLDAEQLEMLLSKLSSRIDMSSVAEFTLEAGRPDTITPEKMQIAKKHGVTRISVNPQTLCDDVLRGIGRAHTSEDFYRAMDMARESGIPCINTDLIAGLPGDSFTGFSKTVDKIIELRPENITVHTFCVKNAADILHSGVNVFSRNNTEAVKCVDYSQVMAMNSGYIPYYLYRQKNTVGNLENVGFSLSGFNGLYNSLIMCDEHNIYAVGAGAVTKLVGKDGPKRFFTPKYPYEYLDENLNSDKRLELFEQLREFECQK